MKKYQVVTSVSVLAIVAMLLLTVSVRENKADQARIAATPEIKAFEVRSSEWGRHYPRQYSTYMQTKKGDAFTDALGELPGMVINWAAMPFPRITAGPAVITTCWKTRRSPCVPARPIRPGAYKVPNRPPAGPASLRMWPG